VKCILFIPLIAVTLLPPLAISDPLASKTSGGMPPPGGVSKDEGLGAWKRIEAVVTHPRCANCHVGPDNTPMWTIVGETRSRPHGMNITADASRGGAQELPCGTCHTTSTAPNTAHAPPHAGIPWQLAPADFVWFGKTGGEICRQMRDPKRNGGRDAAGLLTHLEHDAAQHGFIPWAWSPGGGRSTPPGTFEDHVRDVAAWGAAGQPCPDDPKPQ
jgi:hypothetical protein